MGIDFASVVPKFDAILQRGLCSGLGQRDGQMCIEAAICAALDLPHGDEPECVARTVRRFKIVLNDADWSSFEARAKHLRAVGIAQIGSKGVVDDGEFADRMAKKTVRVLIPKLFRQVFPDNAKCLAAAVRCELEGSKESAAWAAEAAEAEAEAAARAAEAEAEAEAGAAARAAEAAETGEAAWAAARAAEAAWAAEEEAAAAAETGAAAWEAAWAAARAPWTAAEAADEYLILSARLCLETLYELKSPGCEWLELERASTKT